MRKCDFIKVANGPKSGPKLVFVAISSSLVHYFSFKMHRMIAWNNVLLLVEVKLTKKNLGSNFWSSGPKSGPKLGFLPFSEV